MKSQQDKIVEVSAFLRAGNKVSEVENLVSVLRTTVYSTKKRMDDGESVNRQANSGRKSVVDRDSLRDAIKRKNILMNLILKLSVFTVRYG